MQTRNLYLHPFAAISYFSVSIPIFSMKLIHEISFPMFPWNCSPDWLFEHWLMQVGFRSVLATRIWRLEQKLSWQFQVVAALGDLHKTWWPLHLHAFASDPVIELQSFPLQSDQDVTCFKCLYGLAVDTSNCPLPTGHLKVWTKFALDQCFYIVHSVWLFEDANSPIVLFRPFHWLCNDVHHLCTWIGDLIASDWTLALDCNLGLPLNAM